MEGKGKKRKKKLSEMVSFTQGGDAVKFFLMWINLIITTPITTGDPNP